ncbi:hypothetical protein R3P38DRAFT_816385 [Favolaschia claudopus]|uniref:HIT-type domain-containing protein n=1 Tax=Favolaschia claudopus TaxID=2862362 RepID=A0AAW0BX43_9AGAR
MSSHAQPFPPSHTDALEQKPRTRHRRCRTLSVSVPFDGNAPKIKIAVQSSACSSPVQVATGAFTLTGSARTALRSLVSGSSDDDSDANEESYDAREYTIIPRHIRSRSVFSDKDLPSISRTASPFEGERQPVPPGWGLGGRSRVSVKARKKERERSRSRERCQSHEQSGSTRIHPALEALERCSRVGSRVECAACGTLGVNFPRCPRCTKTWCSRPCRMSPIHRCLPRRSTITS